MAETAFHVMRSETGGSLRLSGEIDISNLDLLKAALESVRDDGDVHLEMDDLAFIDLAGTTVLVNRAADRAPSGRLVLHRPPYAMRRIMDAIWGPMPSIEVNAS